MDKVGLIHELEGIFSVVDIIRHVKRCFDGEGCLLGCCAV
jgi:hypothetical protein